MNKGKIRGTGITHREMIAREGWSIIASLLAISLTVWWLWGVLAALLPSVLVMFSVYFFRNPERSIVANNDELVSPADGRVMDVMPVYENEYFDQEMLRIRIFLNLFSVHINRIPVAGQIRTVERTGAHFLPAYKDEAGHLNVRNTVVMDTQFGAVKIVQITGLIARRLVCWVQPGDLVHSGQRFGMIRFGSCTELYVDDHVHLSVKPGDRVKGGSSILARFNTNCEER